jgi:hypothetical protein
MLDFQKLLFEGVVGEFAVMKMINQEPEMMRDLLLQGSVTHDNTWNWTCVEAYIQDLYDLRLIINNTEAYFPVEVKTARNGGAYDTFFVETLQIGSNTYPEFLLAEPTYICYVDTLNGEHYWYDGKKFVSKVKENIADEFIIPVGTAKGLKFPKEGKDWGFIVSYKPDFTFKQVVEENRENIRAKLNCKEKQGSQVKEVVGLPTLS